MRDFLKKITILLSKIFTKKALIYIILFLLILILRTTKSQAFSMDDLSTSGFDSSQKQIIYNFVQEHKASYDSVFVAYGFFPSSR